MSGRAHTAGAKVLMLPDYRKDNPYQELLASALTRLGVQVAFATHYRRLLPVWRSWRSAGRPAVIHMHWQNAYVRSQHLAGFCFYATKLLFDLVLTKWGGARLVWTVHNEIPHDARWPGMHRVLQRGMAWLADSVIFHSAESCERMAGGLALNRKKAHVVPHGSYRAAYGPAIEKVKARESLGLPSGGLVFLHLGMLRPYKGVDHLIETWAGLGGATAGSLLVIAGKPLDSEYGELLAQAASRAERISLRPGFVADEDIHVYLSAADWAVLPFRKILTSGSLLLAQSYDLPVIVPRVASIASNLRHDNSITYDPDQQDGLATALTEAIEKRSPPVGMAPMPQDWGPIARETLGAYGG